MEEMAVAPEPAQLGSRGIEIGRLVQQLAPMRQHLVAADHHVAGALAGRFEGLGFGEAPRNHFGFRAFPQLQGFDRPLVDFDSTALELEARPRQQGVSCLAA